MKISSIGEEVGGQWAAKLLILFKIGVKGSIGNHEYAFLLHVELTITIETVGKALGSVCLRWSTNNEVHHGL